jgi:hypothetical protein
MVYGGSIHSGKWKGESLNIVSAFEALEKFNNTITEDLKELFKTHVLEQVPAEECIQPYHFGHRSFRNEFTI